jgi:hypothetical protein
MFTFLKKVLGLDSKTMADAGVQIEQVPYKVEATVEAVPAAKVDAPTAAPAAAPAPAKKKRYYAKKTSGTAKKATPKKEVAKGAPAKHPSKKPTVK